jgi:hypothetical protein
MSLLSLNEPSLTHVTNYAQRLLVRLQREVFDRGRKAHDFRRLCDMAAIPRDLRTALLQSLVRHGYVQAQGGDLVALTTTGMQLAKAPAPVAALSNNPSPREGSTLARTPGSRMRG